MFQLSKLPNNKQYIKFCEDKGGFKKPPKSIQLLMKERTQTAITNTLIKDTNNALDAKYIPKEQFQAYNLHEFKTENQKDKTALKNLTVIRPSVNKYWSDKYSLEEWLEYNNKVLNNDKVSESNIVDYNAQTAIMAATGRVDQVQRGNERKLKQRVKEIFRWKLEAEEACKAIAKEVELLEMERQRFINASRSLILAESITKECIDVRSNRTESELVADAPEQELIKEIELVNKMRDYINTSIQKLEEQSAIDKAAKHRIEYDWCDKSVAYNTDSDNLSLDANNNTIMFKCGAVKFSNKTAPSEYYVYYSRKNIENVEVTGQHSINLRSSLNSILITKSKELKEQADKTDKMLANTITLTTAIITKLEEHLKNTLKSLADTEILIQNLQEAVLKMDRAMKLSQTRLDNRNNHRPHGENVRDEPHLGLLQEVKIIHESSTSLLMEMKKAEKVRMNLIEKRLEIEKDIASKKKSLDIDRLRCGMIRSHYPNASQLAGL